VPSAVARRSDARQARANVRTTAVERSPLNAASTAKTAQTPGAHAGATSASSGQERDGSVMTSPTTRGRQPTTSNRLLISATYAMSKTAPNVSYRIRIGYPFSPVVAMPSTKYRWPSRKMTAIGSTDSTEPVMMSAYSALYCEMNVFNPSWMVRRSGLRR